MAQPEPLSERLNRNCSKGGLNECWNWTGKTNPQGYAPMRYGGRHSYAHRLSYELHKGEIPTGYQVLHSCDNPRCINPAHLSVGTAQDNTNDMISKGRGVYLKGTAAPRAKLSAEQVREIRSSPLGCYRLAKKYAVSKKTVLKIRHGISYQDVS